MSDLAGRVALVTGASGGIGAAVAERLAGIGARVALHYGRNREPAEELQRRLGGETIVVGADLADPDAPERVVEAVERGLGPVDVLVANAGTAERRPLDEIDLALWDETFAVNARAPFFLAQRVIPGMRERGFGRILFTSSVAGFVGGIIGPHYGGSKAALHAVVHYLATQLAKDGITVNAVAPALIEGTAMLPGAPDDLARLIPVGRLGKPAEVADLMLAMLENGYLTSQIVGIDGGMYAR